MPNEFHIVEECFLNSKAVKLIGSAQGWDEFRDKYIDPKLKKDPRIAGKFHLGPCSYVFVTKTEPAYRVFYEVNNSSGEVLLSDIQIASGLLSSHVRAGKADQ